MLFGDTVFCQVRTGQVPFQMRFDIVLDVLQIGRIGTVALFPFVVARIQHAARLHLDGIDDTAAVHADPERGLPVNGLQAADQPRIGGNGITLTFTACLCDGVGEAGIGCPQLYAELHILLQNQTLLSFKILFSQEQYSRFVSIVSCVGSSYHIQNNHVKGDTSFFENIFSIPY